MKCKTLLLVFALLAIMAGSLFATDSRMAALGYPFGLIRDDSDISSFPGAINRYNRSMFGELSSPGSSSGWTLGTNLPVRDFVWGVYLNKPTGTYIDSYFSPNPGTNYYSSGDLDISRKIQFYLGMMDTFGFGFGMAIDSKKSDLTDNPNKYSEASATYLDFSGGMSTDIMDIGAKFNIAGASVKNDFNDYGNDYSEFGFQASGRYYLMDDSDLAVMALGDFALASIVAKEKTTPTVTTYTTYKDTENTFMIDFGAGVNYKMGNKNTIIFGVKPFRLANMSWKTTVSSSSGEEGTKYSYLYVPEYNLALESQVFPWLTGRIGARQNYVFYSRTYDPTGDWDNAGGHQIDEDSYYSSSFVMNCGLGFKFGKFGIDTVLSKSFLHDGPYFIGGISNGLASQISVQYNN